MKREGFTLIEIALALVVVAIGVLAVFGLMSAGMNMCTKAISDTQMAVIASDFLGSIRAMASYQAQKEREDRFEKIAYNPNYWGLWWTNFATGNRTVPMAAVNTWNTNSTTAGMQVDKMSNTTAALLAKFAGSVYGPVFLRIMQNEPQRPNGPTNIVNYAFRYRSYTGNYRQYTRAIPWIDRFGTFYQRTFTLQSSYDFTFDIWDGKHGDEKLTNSVRFYTEYSDPGDL